MGFNTGLATKSKKYSSWISENCKRNSNGVGYTYVGNSKSTQPAPQVVNPTINVSGVNPLPNTVVKYGNSFGLRGEFSSNGTITGIYGEISKNGERVQWQTIYPNSSSVNIRYTAINDNLKFNKLAKGTYIYYLEVQAEKNGKYVNWTNGGVQFTIS